MRPSKTKNCLGHLTDWFKRPSAYEETFHLDQSMSKTLNWSEQRVLGRCENSRICPWKSQVHPKKCQLQRGPRRVLCKCLAQIWASDTDNETTVAICFNTFLYERTRVWLAIAIMLASVDFTFSHSTSCAAAEAQGSDWTGFSYNFRFPIS